MQVKKNHKTTTGLAEAVETGIVWTWRRWPSLRRGDALKDCGENVSKPGADPLGVSAGCGTEGMSQMYSNQGHRHQKKKSHNQCQRAGGLGRNFQKPQDAWSK